jgi:uncharacterized metal-binding protein YceD (DUF177 family)
MSFSGAEAHMTPPPPEFSRIIGLHQIGDSTRMHALVADESERAALARRFDLLALDRLEARLQLHPDGTGWRAAGQLSASLAQACVATGESVAEVIDTPVILRFVPEGSHAENTFEEAIELSEDALDEMPFDGERIDLGEAIAQTLALSLTPFPRIADAEARLRAAGVLREEDAGPFAALAALKGALGKSSGAG